MPRRSLGVDGTGRSSIPETAVMESKSRGVLDTPHARGMTVLGSAQDGWSDLSAVARRAKAEAIPIMLQTTPMGFAKDSTHPARAER